MLQLQYAICFAFDKRGLAIGNQPMRTHVTVTHEPACLRQRQKAPADWINLPQLLRLLPVYRQQFVVG